MRKLTQTNLFPIGNCWQTVVACILDIDPETMPDQSKLELQDEKGERKTYHNHLQEYLAVHHDMRYVSIWEEQFGGVLPKKDLLYMWCGPTIRTPETGATHVVIAQNDQMVWDPHPSQAGLTKVTSWGFLLPMIPAWRETRTRMRESGSIGPCQCPKCLVDNKK